mmetsp:Transcript_25969/g.43800  ORF Transcript_25969/g.43800 Transcript_25969/m.43800 type:complete len:116 (+) Transcript_25969:485-832(+)
MSNNKKCTLSRSIPCEEISLAKEKSSCSCHKKCLQAICSLAFSETLSPYGSHGHSNSTKLSISFPLKESCASEIYYDNVAACQVIWSLSSNACCVPRGQAQACDIQRIGELLSPS